MTQAFILAAGFGTRLLPLTRFVPKPLFPVCNIPAITRIVDQLVNAGFERVFINIHHLAHKIEAFLETINTDIEIILLKEKTILGTGGGIAQAIPQLDPNDHLLIYNGDIVCDIDLNVFRNLALKNPDYTAHMLVHARLPFNNVRVAQGEVTAFGYGGGDAKAYCGISILHPSCFGYFHDEFPYSLIEVFQKSLGDGKKIKAIEAERIDSDYIWADIGTLAGYLDANAILLKKYGNRMQVTEVQKGCWSVVGDNVKIGRYVRLNQSVVWDGCFVEEGACLERAVVTPYGTMK